MTPNVASSIPDIGRIAARIYPSIGGTQSAKEIAASLSRAISRTPNFRIGVSRQWGRLVEIIGYWPSG
jgi:hypothetical protein